MPGSGRLPLRTPRRVSAAMARILPRATERFRELVDRLPTLVAEDPWRGRCSMGDIVLGMTEDGFLETSIPLIPPHNLLGAKRNGLYFGSGSGV